MLKPGGALVVGLIDRESPLGRGYEKRKGESLFYREAAFFSAAEAVAMMKAAGFGDFVSSQTLFRPPEAIEEVEPVREGHGLGAFVVIRGTTTAPVA